MKKWMIILCAAVILLAFCACQSEQAKAVDAQISAIGAVNLDSEPLISDAERALLASGKGTKAGKAGAGADAGKERI